MYKVLTTGPRGWQARPEGLTRLRIRWRASSRPLLQQRPPFSVTGYGTNPLARITGEPTGGLLKVDPEFDSLLRVRGEEDSTSKKRLLPRLKGRKMVEWLLAYLALAWMALQLTDVLAEIWNWPIALQRSITLIAAMGIFPALVVAWFHGEKGRQRVCCTEVGLVALMLLGTAALVVLFC